MFKSVLIINSFFYLFFLPFLSSQIKIETDSPFLDNADEIICYLFVYKMKGGTNKGDGGRGNIYLTVLFFKTLKIQNKTKLIRT